MTIKAVLKQIQTNHAINPVRQPEKSVAGFYNRKPKVGDKFYFYGTCSTTGTEGGRQISTSPVVEIISSEEGDVLVTENSQYRLTLENS